MDDLSTHYQAYLLMQVQAMEALLPGVLQGEDIECLHDYRVAVRRSRSVLSALAGFEHRHGLREWRRFFRQLARITTPVRDLDVLLASDSDAPSLPNMVSSSFSLQEHLIQLRQAAREHLCAFLQSAAYSQQLHDWQDFLEQGLLSSCLRSDLSPQQFYPVILRQAMARIKKDAGYLDAQATAEQYHELRKACKVLRYRLEMLSGDERAEKLIKRLKRLQDLLGAFQDNMVRLHYLREYYHACHILIPPLTATVPSSYIGCRGKEIRQAVRDFLAGPTRGLYRQLVEELQSD